MLVALLPVILGGSREWCCQQGSRHQGDFGFHEILRERDSAPQPAAGVFVPKSDLGDTAER
jgi:hypothetical protein